MLKPREEVQRYSKKLMLKNVMAKGGFFVAKSMWRYVKGGGQTSMLMFIISHKNVEVKGGLLFAKCKRIGKKSARNMKSLHMTPLSWYLLNH